MNQSPIRMQVSDSLPLAEPLSLFECKYQPGQISGCFEGESGHANFVVQGAGPVIHFRGVRYELKKIHIHSESEHIVEQDDPHDLEVHLIHVPFGSPVAAPLVVVGVLFTVAGKKSKSNNADSALAEFIKSAESKVCVTLDPLDLFPRNSKGKPDTTAWFHYEGSLTSYPYSEIVSWVVMRDAPVIDKSLIEDFKKFAEQHSREVQPLDRRLVVRSFTDRTKKR